MTGRRPPPPPVSLPSASPVRGFGTPLRAKGPPLSRVGVPSDPRVRIEGLTRTTRGVSPRGSRLETDGSKSNEGMHLEEDDEGGAIQEFYGQLWFVPDIPVSAVTQRKSGLEMRGTG